MAKMTGAATLGIQDLYTSNAQPNYAYELGQLVFGQHGKAFRYARFGELGVVGDIMQSAAVDTQFDSMTVPAAVAVNSTSVTITNGTTAVSVGDFVGGTLSISVTPGLGEEYTIVGHGTATSGSSWTIDLDRPLRTAWTTSTKPTIRPSPWSKIVKCPTSLTGVPVGVCIYPVASGSYGWVQTKGIAGVLSDNSTGAVGSDVGVPGASAGSVGVNVAGTGKSNTIGRAYRALSSGVVVPVYLIID